MGNFKTFKFHKNFTCINSINIVAITLPLSGMCATTDQHVVGGRCRRMSSNEIQEKTPQTKRRHYKPRPSAEAIESRSRNAVNDNDNSHLTAKEDKGLAKPGASCAQGQDCTGGAVCTLEGLCGCPDDEVEIEGVCIGNNVEALQV